MDTTEEGRPQWVAEVGIGVVDLAGNTTWTDDVLAHALGYSSEEFAALTFTQYAHPDDVGDTLARFTQLVRGDTDRYTIDKRLIRKDGATLWVNLTVSLVRDTDGNPDFIIGVHQDITERRRIEGEPGDEEERVRLQVERIPAIVYVAEPGPTGRWFYVSPQIEVILGFSAAEWMADPGLWLERLLPQDREIALAEEERVLGAADAEERTYSATYRLRHRDGSSVWVRDDATMQRDQEGRATWHGVLVDVTREKLLEERLEHQAFHDPLTGLPNRRLFRDRVGHALSRRHTGRVAVLFMDLDNFKIVNDGFGHACGDEVIVATARRLQMCARAEDTAARLGGDEFALLLEDVSAGQVGALAERVLVSLSGSPVAFSGRTLTVGASIGIALAEPGETTETLLRNADLAMYEAKLQGGGRSALYEPALHANVVNRFRLEEALQGALADGAISLAYQPIVDLTDGVVVGFEALARWSDRDIGDVPPAEFIPIAEETGLIHELGRWAIDRACGDLTAWRSAHGVPAFVSVNVSPIQLRDDLFASTVVPILLDHGLEPAALMLEVTEGVPLAGRSRESLRELRAHGVRVAIDDFGTGYSSLSYLRQLPVDMVKIDQTFLGPSGDAFDESAFLGGIIRLAETMQLATICEGVETPHQLSELQVAGCGYGQGNLLAKACPIADVPANIQVV